jgi:hypothetical protein
MNTSLRRLALLNFTLFTLSAALAVGGREDPLKYADTLIAAQKYDEAILYPDRLHENLPDRFDQAQAKLRRIIEIRLAYDEKANVVLG